MKVALATMLLLTLSVAHAPVSAQEGARAHLRLLVVDQTNAPVADAVVTVYTLDGRPGVTITADAKGTVVLPDVAVGMSQIVAKSAGSSRSVEKVTLHAGDNAQTITLRAAKGES